MFIFYDINENFGRALEDDGDDEVWKMIQQENFYLKGFRNGEQSLEPTLSQFSRFHLVGIRPRL